MVSPQQKNNKYKLIQRLVSLSEPRNNPDQIWDQWTLCDTIPLKIKHIDKDSLSKKITDWNTHAFHDEDKCKYQICLCSHTPICVLNLMENNYTKERCIIGSCCIKKFATDDIKNDMKIKIGEKEGKRYCQLCKRKMPDNTESWKSYHKKCYFKNKNNAQKSYPQ